MTLETETQNMKVVECPNHGAGRFEGNSAPCVAAVLDSWHMDGCAQDEVGDTEGIGHAAFFTIPKAFSIDPMADVDAQTSTGYDVCDSCLEAFKGQYGAAIFTDSQGFIQAELYATPEAFKVAVAHAEAEDAAFNAADTEDSEA